VKTKSGIYLIPDREMLSESEELRKEYNASYEYNDFFLASVLDDRRLQEEMIEAYAKVKSDFSSDTIHGAFLDVTLHSSDPLIREVSEKRVIQSMEIAKRMGVRGVVFHTNRIYGLREPAYLTNWKSTNERFFRKLAEQYPKQEILIENMFDEAPDVLLELAESLSDVPNIGVCLDYAHAAVYGEKPETWLELLAPHIRHLHLNDNDLKEDLHLPAGTGRIDWACFEQMRKRYHVEASALVEVKGVARQREELEFMRRNGIYL